MAQFIAFSAGLIMGTGSTLTIKIAYSLNGTDSHGINRPFEKPLSTTFVMFLAMFFSLPTYYLITTFQQCCSTRTSIISKQSKSSNNENSHINSPLLHDLAGGECDEDDHVVASSGLTTRLFFLLLVPALFDLLGTALAKVGLMYCDVSTYQLVRCTVIVFTAIAKQCLGQRLPPHVWAGVVIITTAMIFVSASSLIEAADDTTPIVGSGVRKDPKIGIVFLMLSCVVASLQYVFEEKVMSEDGAHPLIVVGMEGFWGICLFVTTVFPWAYILPGSDVGSLENVYDSWIMARSNVHLQYALGGFFVTVALYNVMAVYLTHLMSSVWHAILDCFRPVSVWGTDLLLFYVVSTGTFGEPWTNWSYLELAGMLLLFFGTAVFNGNVVLPCCPPSLGDDKEEDEVLNPYGDENDEDGYFYDGEDGDVDPTTPLYFVNSGPDGVAAGFMTPRTRSQHKPQTPSTRAPSSGDFCRSPLLSRSAAKRAYQERTVVGFSRWVNQGGRSSDVISSNLRVTSFVQPVQPPQQYTLSDPSAMSRMYRQQKEVVSTGGEGEGQPKRKFGRDVSNRRN
jgi:hypothetical protein